MTHCTPFMFAGLEYEAHYRVRRDDHGVEDVEVWSVTETGHPIVLVTVHAVLQKAAENAAQDEVDDAREASRANYGGY